MVDLHCHILPGVDDGSQSLSQSLAMASLAIQGGTDTIVATPHCGLPGGQGNFWGPEMKERFRALVQALKEAELPLRLLPGMEFFGGSDLKELWQHGNLLPLAGSQYLLTEFYFDESLSYMEEVFEQAVSCGLTPVAAHPERYQAVQQQPERIEAWFRRGYIIQLNKGSILGDLGSRAEQTAWELLSHGLAHAVASDAHSHLRRTPDMSRVRKLLDGELGRDYTSLLLEENPRRITQNRPVARELPDR